MKGKYNKLVFAIGGACTFVCLIFSVASQAGYIEGVTAYETGRFDTALREFNPLLERGHAGAEFMTGVMYFQGRGVPQNRKIAAIWFYKAAIKGHAGAQLAFGSIHIRGIGVYQDLVQAYKWLTLAADSKLQSLKQRATSLLGDAEKLMTADEVANAKSAARNFSPTAAGLALR
jgi:hypothetical protein